jgi:alpha-galactosidase
LHSLVREHVIPPAFRHVQCPVLVNTWEAEYFNVSHDSVVAMARAAKSVDVEMIVLDDGWFGERHDATSSLGDWSPNLDKFPFGIRGLVQEVNAEGMAFGLWIEPEMVSTNSRLYREHPDWCLQLPGRVRHEGRNQLVLDLTRPEVREHVFESIACTLRAANVIYVKWDMNRHLTEAFSVALPGHRQGEVIYRYTLGVYALHHRFVTAFPEIRFEACSGGGGRFDLGILFFCPQVWTSDNTDAVMRMRIQTGTSFVFPAMTAGSHYSTVPNHITQGITRKRTRALVAMCGTFGYELDLRNTPADQTDTLRRQIAAHKLVHPIVRDGDLFRLWDPFRVSYCAWMYVLRTKDHHGQWHATKAAVFAFNMSSTFWSNMVPRLLLRGLDPDALYTVSEPLPNNRMQKTVSERASAPAISMPRPASSSSPPRERILTPCARPDHVCLAAGYSRGGSHPDARLPARRRARAHALEHLDACWHPRPLPHPGRLSPLLPRQSTCRGTAMRYQPSPCPCHVPRYRRRTREGLLPTHTRAEAIAQRHANIQLAS